jgi:hypothetical protein
MSKTAHELTRKEMKGPDRFQVAAADAASWLGKHQKKVLVAAGAAVVIAVVGTGISYMVESGREQAGGLLYRAIDAASGEISTVLLPNFDRPTFKTAEEKQRAVLDAAAKVRERHCSRGTRTSRSANGTRPRPPTRASSRPRRRTTPCASRVSTASRARRRGRATSRAPPRPTRRPPRSRSTRTAPRSSARACS